MHVIIGLEISQSRRHGAICVTQLQQRGPRRLEERHWVVRHLERLAIGTSYPAISERLSVIAHSAHHQGGRRPELIVNVTGIGMPVISLLRSSVSEPRRIIPVFFNQGDRRKEEGDARDPSVTLGKAYLVSGLQTALQAGRLHLPRNEECRVLAQELMSYQIEVQPDANERYGAFRVGTRDDLVTALGLTVQHEPGPTRLIARPRRLRERIAPDRPRSLRDDVEDSWSLRW